jgi:hypothetical protein
LSIISDYNRNCNTTRNISRAPTSRTLYKCNSYIIFCTHWNNIFLRIVYSMLAIWFRILRECSAFVIRITDVNNVARSNLPNISVLFYDLYDKYCNYRIFKTVQVSSLQNKIRLSDSNWINLLPICSSNFGGGLHGHRYILYVGMIL